MDSAIIEIRGCPLDPDLLKSWERFSLENYQSQTSSDASESADENFETRSGVSKQQFKNISSRDVPDSEYLSFEGTNETAKISCQKKNDIEKRTFSEKTKINKNQFYYSGVQNNKLLKDNYESSSDTSAEDESDSDNNEFEKSAALKHRSRKLSLDDETHSDVLHSKDVSSKCLNKTANIIDQKKNNIGRRIFFENTKNIEKQFSTLSLENEKLINNYCKGSSNTFSENESDSEDDEPEESVTLRERAPTRNKGNKPARPTPFPQNHSRTYKQNLSLNDFQTYGNSHSTSNNFNASYNVHDSHYRNSRNFERNARISHPPFSNPESLVDKAIVGGSLVTYEIAVGIPYTVGEVASDGVVPSPSKIENVNEEFFTEIHDEHNSKDNTYYGPIDRDYAVTNVRLDAFVDLTEELANYVPETLTESKPDSYGSSYDSVDLTGDSSLHVLSGEDVESYFNSSSQSNENDNIAYSSEEATYPNRNSNSETDRRESYIPEKSDYRTLSEEIDEIVKKMTDFKRIYFGSILESTNIDQTCQPTTKSKEQKIDRIWKNTAKEKLFESSSFCETYDQIADKMLDELANQIEKGELGNGKKTIIHFLKRNRKTKYKGTNLHHAIRSDVYPVEKVVWIVELHKKCNCTTFEINLRDSCNKTVLDYAKEKGLDLLSDYLIENDAVAMSSCLVPGITNN